MPDDLVVSRWGRLATVEQGRLDDRYVTPRHAANMHSRGQGKPDTLNLSDIGHVRFQVTHGEVSMRFYCDVLGFASPDTPRAWRRRVQDSGRRHSYHRHYATCHTAGCARVAARTASARAYRVQGGQLCGVARSLRRSARERRQHPEYRRACLPVHLLHAGAFPFLQDVNSPAGHGERGMVYTLTGKSPRKHAQ